MADFAEIAALRDSVRRRRSLVGFSRGGNPVSREAQVQMRAYLLGLLSARLNDTTAARQHAAELERLSRAPGDSGVGRDLAHGVRAAIARTQGALEPALAELEQYRFDPSTRTYRLIAHAGVRERFLRAELLHALGRDREALQWYGSFAGSRDLIFFAPVHYRQGQIHERLGAYADAIRHYTRFIDLWRDCDPELRPQLEEARRALAQLQASR